MKKYLLYALMLLTTGSFTACSDDDNVSEEVEREFMTMFRMDDNTGRGDSDPYRCQTITDPLNGHNNAVHLYWYGVNGCKGYEIKMALQPNVSSGLASDWENPNYILLDTIMGPNDLDMVIHNMEYSTDYRFAIRTLSMKGDAYNSKWYGYGSGRQWAEYLGLTTGNRYPVPEIITQSAPTKTTVRIYINRSYSDAVANWNSSETDPDEFDKNFEIDGDNFVMQRFTVEPSSENPDAEVPDKWTNYTLTDEDFTRGYIDVDGLSESSVYIINVENINVPVKVDAVYNTLSVRTDGEVGDPILIEHVTTPNDTLSDGTTLTDAPATYDAMRLDETFTNYVKDNTLAEGTIFELEGGKTYYFKNNMSLSKGFTLRTNPDDIAAGKGHAKVCLGGLWKEGNTVRSCNFMFGRQPQSGESFTLFVKSLEFDDIDFDCPLAECFNGTSNGTGNYFINMYSNGMAVTLQSFTVKNCNFNNMIRGFIRVQGTKVKRFENITVEGCNFKNCGYYDNNGRGYAWVAGDGKQPKSNIYVNCVFRNNTFYDSPRTCLFTDNGKNLDWGDDIHYNITLENNTFVNFSTRSSGRQIFDLRYLPGGSTITCRNNLFILTKDDADERNLYQCGMDIRTINGTQEATFIFENNWSTNNNLTGTQIFTGNAFNATKNAAGKWPEMCPNGVDELEVHVDDISATELMSDPNPKNYEQGDATLRHHHDSFDGLYYNNTDKVKNSNIYKLGIGASQWRESVQ
jgi:hypothetical protein